MNEAADSHYWAGGKKVTLDADPRLAIDVDAAKGADLWEGNLASLVESSGSEVRSGIVLVPASEVSDRVRLRLDQAGAAMPVYRHDDTTFLVRPQVRVETNDPATKAALQSAVDNWSTDVTLAEPRPGRFVLTPTSGHGEEALDLANHVFEQVKPDVVQANLLRITAPPEPPTAPVTKQRPR